MIGILGGSFDPPHNGHKFISQYAMMRLNLQEVWWIVTYKNPLKKKSTNYNYRFKQVKKFIKLKVPKVKTASKAIGIAEIKEYLKKKIEISEVIEKISIKTRQYAKRQSTWGRGNMMDWNKIKSEDLNKFLKKI